MSMFSTGPTNETISSERPTLLDRDRERILPLESLNISIFEQSRELIFDLLNFRNCYSIERELFSTERSFNI